ncbi:MAG: DUF1501 domain-containing protein [Chloroflexota bacterium]
MTTEEGSTFRCCDENFLEEYRRKTWSWRANRRDFLKTTVGALAAAPLAPHMFLNSAMAQHASNAPTDGPILVVIQLAGGNDGLNTIVPYGSGTYYQDRPTIGVPAKSVLPIDNMVGFHPNLKGMKTLFDQGKVAILQGAGYPDSSLSHFQGTQIWETADPSGLAQTGWLGRYLDAEIGDSGNPLTAIAVGPMLPITLLSQRTPATTIENVQSFRFFVNRLDSQLLLGAYDQMYGTSTGAPAPYLNLIRSAGRDAQQGVHDLQSISTKYSSTVKYPVNPLARDLQLVAQIIASNLGTRVFHVTLGGFDDHVAEVYTHARLMQFLGDSLVAFYQDLKLMNKDNQVVTMTFSEFGRRVRENAGRGTDHGTSAPMFVVGSKVKGGMYGKDPILSALDSDGNLEFGIDFRSVYGTVIDGWLNGNSPNVLGGSYERLPFL